MCMDLFSQSGSCFTWNNSSWRKVVDLGIVYGWEPKGTENIPDGTDNYEVEEGWCGTYFSNDGQLVSAEDALALANALERALDDNPDVENCDKWVTTSTLSNTYEMVNENLSIPDFLSGDMKKGLLAFISFCHSTLKLR